ncbi:TonB-linked SusC/RagA family outer membrane protein [Chitinophaga polysaccharea]|uniref:TonB-linked SusC/RagA family outer membrane protein n=1 Tax=Chitinophaga polysaccharea TaxID=1293035 RepID=A0A561PLD6_9BACT|nr:TonB-dependent receptor [Chitinophaga polysaccharea]TWF38933.1 TonB-linked SusC/RagA family outer membrane protein [Chitinophaga polysaccharea]
MNNGIFPTNINQKKRVKVILLCLLLCLAAQLRTAAQSYLQKQTTINFSYETIASCLKKLQTKSAVNISYNESDVKKYTVNTLSFQDAGITQILDALLQNTNLQYRTMNDGIVIFVKAEITAHAAFRTITGIVTSAKEKSPVPGASILVKGTTRGTATDENGAFAIKVPTDKNMLVFSAVGMQSREFIITGDKMDVQLSEDSRTLGSIVVVGYGQVDKKDLTGSVSSVKTDDMKKMNTTSFDAALAGRTAGVNAVKSTGAPGAVASIRIRGGTSVYGNNEPLYVIDGVPFEVGNGQGNAQYANDINRQISPLASLNPEDIESMDILKDASAAAIYGSRAANGVVIITTKRGHSGPKADISVGYTATMDNFAKKQHMMNGNEYLKAVQTAYSNAGRPMPKDSTLYPGVSTDWQKLLTRPGMTNNLYLNINGGSNNGSTLYSVSGSVTDQAGVIRGSGFKRYNLRSRLETTLFDRLRLGTNMAYAVMETNTSNTYYNIIRYRPDVPPYDSLGRYGATPDSSSANPVAMLSRINQQKSQNMLLSFFGEIELWKGLRWRSDLSYNIVKGNMVGYTPASDVFEMRNARTGSREDYINNSNSRIFDNMLTYLKSFGRHNINAVAGMSFQQSKSDFTNIKSNNFSDDESLNHLGGASILNNWSSGGTISGLQSYFLRANYNFAGKYYFTFTGRADESTKFSPGNRWAFFPSAAIAYRLSEAGFMKRATWLEDLKLRMSLGKTGSANFSDFQYTTLFTSGSFYNKKNGMIVNDVPNPDIRWESTNQLDAAVDFSMFKSRLRGTIGYFKKYTRDMILYRSIPMETGAAQQYYNVGDFSNRGWEIQVGSDVIRRRHFSYITDVNITRIRSRVEKLNGGFDLNGQLVEGRSMGYFEGFKTAGIFQSKEEIDALNKTAPGGFYQSSSTAPGDLKFVDVNGDGRITDDDRGIIGKSEPDFFGGWNNIVRIGKWEITAFLNFSIGNSLDNRGRKNVVYFNGYTNNYAKEMLYDSWSPSNKVASLPRIVTGDPNQNGRTSDFFIEKASYLKLKNVQVAYTFNTPALSRVRISSIRAFLSGTNLLTFTRYKGLDPEVNMAPASNFSQGIDTNIYPLTRSFAAGINVNL